MSELILLLTLFPHENIVSSCLRYLIESLCLLYLPSNFVATSAIIISEAAIQYRLLVYVCKLMKQVNQIVGFCSAAFAFLKFIATAETKTEMDYTMRAAIATLIMCSLVRLLIVVCNFSTLRVHSVVGEV